MGRPDLQKIVRAVERHWKLPPGAVMASTRGTPRAALARRVAMYLRFTQIPASAVNWSALGREFGRDRSTVREAVRWVERDVKDGLDLRAVRAALRSR